MTTIDDFRGSVSDTAPPADAGPALQALWWARKEEWKKAHECVRQREGNPDCDLVHAHLHRQEGDMKNASGWYRRVGRPLPTVPLDEEWSVIATELLVRK